MNILNGWGLGISDKRRQEKYEWHRKFMCIFVSHVNAHGRSFTAQNALNQPGGLENLFFKERITKTHPYHYLCNKPLKKWIDCRRDKIYALVQQLGVLLIKAYHRTDAAEYSTCHHKYNLIGH